MGFVTETPRESWCRRVWDALELLVVRLESLDALLQALNLGFGLAVLECAVRISRGLEQDGGCLPGYDPSYCWHYHTTLRSHSRQSLEAPRQAPSAAEPNAFG